MQPATFEAELVRDGYTPVRIAMQPDAVNPEHQHPFDARLLVIEGSVTIVRDGAPTAIYAVGDTFEVPAGTRHSETAGPTGATYVAGRRAPTKEMAQ